MRLKIAASTILGASLQWAGSAHAAAIRSDAPAAPTGFRWRVAASRIAFDANRGQTDRAVRFVSRTPDAVLFLTDREAVWRIAAEGGRGGKKSNRASASPVTTETFRMALAGASYSGEPVGEGPLDRTSNYLTGSDPARWKTGVPSFARVRYPGLYPGVDLVFHDGERRVEFDFLVAPGADPAAIRLRLPDVRSAAIDSRGDLRLATRGGQRRLSRPAIYQETENGRSEIAGNFVLSPMKGEEGLTVAFHVGAYDRSKSLVIDPTLLYSTYLGATDDDMVQAIAADGAGNAYVTGRTFGLDFPGVDGSSLQPVLAGVQDAFVAKINAAGTDIVYSTYLGGNDSDIPSAIAVDDAGDVYLAGQTNSTDFPGTSASAIQPHNAGDYDAFVAKLDPAGSAVVFATYLGTGGYEDAHGIAVGPGRNVYVVGETDSPGFPGTSASPIQPTSKGGGFDAFVSEINSGGTAIVYSTYLGGTGADYGFGIAVDRRASAYVTGATTSGDFIAAAASPIRSGLSGPQDPGDAYVAKIAPAGASLVYSTYLGGENTDYGTAIALDPIGRAYVAGVTTSTLFTGASGSAIQPHLNGGSDGFLAKIDPDGGTLLYSTYLGGSEGDVATALAVDPSGRAYVAGATASPDFPGAAGNPIQGQYGDGSDATVAVIDSEGTRILFSTYLGGAGEDLARAIALDGSGNILVGGGTLSAGFPAPPRARSSRRFSTRGGWTASSPRSRRSLRRTPRGDGPTRSPPCPPRWSDRAEAEYRVLSPAGFAPVGRSAGGPGRDERSATMAKGFLLGVFMSVLLAGAAGYYYFSSGRAPVATASAPMPFERTLARMGLHGYLDRLPHPDPPVPADEPNLLAGARLYKEHCAVCHGLPGGTKTAIAAGMAPKPPQLFAGKGVTDDEAWESYWKVEGGIRMTGMPGFKGLLTETEIWQTSVLVKNADKLSPAVRSELGTAAPAK